MVSEAGWISTELLSVVVVVGLVEHAKAVKTVPEVGHGDSGSTVGDWGAFAAALGTRNDSSIQRVRRSLRQCRSEQRRWQTVIFGDTRRHTANS